MGFVIKAENDWRDVGRPSSGNASQLPRFLVRSVVGDTMHIAGIKTALQSGFVFFRGNLLKHEATATKFDKHIPVLANSTSFTVKLHYLQMQRPQYVIDPSRLDTLSFENGTKHL